MIISVLAASNCCCIQQKRITQKEDTLFCGLLNSSFKPWSVHLLVFILPYFITFYLFLKRRSTDLIPFAMFTWFCLPGFDYYGFKISCHPLSISPKFSWLMSVFLFIKHRLFLPFSIFLTLLSCYSIITLIFTLVESRNIWTTSGHMNGNPSVTFL